MIRVKAVDAQNILDVCKLKTSQDSIGMTMKGYSCCNAISIAETKYHSEMYPNAIYNNDVLIGFFLYKRTENHPETATICRFMIDDMISTERAEGKSFRVYFKRFQNSRR